MLVPCGMGKKNKGSQSRGVGRSIVNPLTGLVEERSGTKAGKKRQTLPVGHPLRTHDLRGSKEKGQ